jgi:hypothetical protein
MMGMALLADVAAGLLTEVVTGTGRRILAGTRGRDVALATWFDTHALTDAELPDVPDAEAAAAVLRTDDAHAILHELLAVRLSDAPDVDAERLASAFVGLFPPAARDCARPMFDHFDERILAIVVRLDGDLLGRIRRDAFLTRITATLGAIERHTAALAARGDRDAEEDFLARYRGQVIAQHGKLQPPDFQRRRRVPVADLYVTPTIAYQEDGAPAETDIWSLDDRIDRTVLLGDPGGGKTTASQVLMHRHATEPSRPVPFLVTLREFAAADPPERSVVGHIEHKLETFYQCPAAAGLVDRLLLSGGALVVFDGLDELIDTARRTDVTAIVEQFCTAYPLSRVLVTSRRVGYDQARLDETHFGEYQITGFNDDRVTEYVEKWFAQDEEFTADEASRYAQDFVAESASVPDLRTNPLMLALMCILYRGEGSIPRSRPEVYEQCATMLFRRWDASRRIRVDLKARNLVEPALRHLAYLLFTREAAEVTERELVTETATYFRGRGFGESYDAEEAAQEFVEFCRGRAWVFSDAGTTARGEELYTFTHRTFMEYFAALQLAGLCDRPEQLARKLLPRIAKQEWEVVAQLAIQIKNRSSDRGGERVFASLAKDRRHRSPDARRNILAFLGRSLAFVSPPEPLVRELTRESTGRLFSSVPNHWAEADPLAFLLAHGDDYIGIILGEVTELIEANLEGQDDDKKGLALRLALYLSDLPQLAVERQERAFPRELADFYKKNLNRNERAILDLAPQEDALAAEAVGTGMIGLDRFLEWHGPHIDVLFEHIMRVKFSTGHSFVHNRLIMFLIQGRVPNTGDTSDEIPAAQLDHVFERLHGGSGPPWVNGKRHSVNNVARDLNGGEERPAWTLNQRQRAAAGALLLTYVELGDEPEAAEAIRRIPHLAPFAELVERRYSGGKKFPVLDVPPRFLEIFEDWADGRVNFVAGRDGSPSDA